MTETIKLPPIAKRNPVMESVRADASQLKELRRLHNFYFVKKDQLGAYKEIAINKVAFVESIRDLGFMRYDIDIADHRFLKIHDNTVEEVNTTLITDTFIKHINHLKPLKHEWGEQSKEIGPDIIKAKLYGALENYFSPVLLKRLVSETPVTFKTDTRTSKFLFYKNCFVEVTKEGYLPRPYSEIDGLVWKNQILNRNFDIAEGVSTFEKFCFNIANQDNNRMRALMSIIGYNLHSFMECKLKATILTDSRLGADGEPNGRTGKTLLCKALGQMLNATKTSSVFTEINGKDYDPADKFKHERCNLDTQLVHFNDVKRNYNMSHSFNDITEGLMVNKKNEKPYPIRSKLIFSTNQTILIDGESVKDRVICFEIADYYSSRKDPSQEFGQWFFSDDWDAAEWHRFDLFMIGCLRDYFVTGLQEPESINLKIKTLRDHTSLDFINFMNDLLVEGTGINYQVDYPGGTVEDRTFTIKRDEQVLKNEIYSIFRKIYPDYNTTQFKQKTFTRWVRLYCTSLNITLEEIRPGGKDYYIFK